jgi:hypothetical protein
VVGPFTRTFLATLEDIRYPYFLRMLRISTQKVHSFQNKSIPIMTMMLSIFVLFFSVVVVYGRLYLYCGSIFQNYYLGEIEALATQSTGTISCQLATSSSTYVLCSSTGLTNLCPHQQISTSVSTPYTYFAFSTSSTSSSTNFVNLYNAVSVIQTPASWTSCTNTYYFWAYCSSLSTSNCLGSITYTVSCKPLFLL